MSVLERMIDPSVADENLRVLQPGDVWLVSEGAIAHTVGQIQKGHSFFLVVGEMRAACGKAIRWYGHARPGRPTCPNCQGMEIPVHIISAARREPFITLRRKDEPIRKPILHDGQVVGFCHPHETPRGFRLGPLYVLPAFRGRGLTRAAYVEHAAGRRCVAYIHHGNVGSEKAHAAAGFLRGPRGRGGWTWVRAAEVNP